MKERVLIAEDNLALSTIIDHTVTRSGFETVVRNNGRAALEAATTQAFDLVISDQQMPQMTGVELRRRLRELDAYRDVPFILLTAKKLELDAAELKEELGVSEVLAKPFSPNRLSALLCELMTGVG